MIDRLNAALEGRYTIERELGAGGMATVYLAADSKHDRQVAIKVLRPELAAVVGADRFLAEIRTTANLQHPHILALFDSGEADGFLFYVMPYVQGESLREKLDREKQLQVEEAVGLARKVADALDYAHGQGVVHRDIKPANILLSARGEPLVADFGIALAVSQAGGGRLTETGLSLGTPHYMSPEQATGDMDVDPRSDVYALGCVLFEMLAGEPPFAAPTAQAVVARILTEDARPVTEARRTVPPHVSSALARSLEKIPADRFGSAAEFAQALADASFRYDPAMGSLTAPSARVTRGLAIAVAALGVALSVALLGGDAPAEGPVVASELHGLPTFDSPVSGGDGTIVHRVDGEDGLWVRAAGDWESRRIAGTEDALANYDLSPDGASVAYLAGDLQTPSLRKIVLAGGAPVDLWTPRSSDEPRFFSRIHWADDGWIYVGVSGLMGTVRSRLVRIPDVRGQSETILEVRQQYLSEPHRIAGSDILLYSRWSYSDFAVELLRLDLATGDTTLLATDANNPVWSPSGHVLYVDSNGLVWALPFHRRRGEASGPAVPVWQGLSVNGTVSHLDLGPTGTLVYRAGPARPVGRGAFRFLLVDEAGNRERLPLAPTDHPDASLSPDGRYLAYTRSNDIWVFELDRGTTTRITEGGTGLHDPLWSPDGGRIAYTGPAHVEVQTFPPSGDPVVLRQTGSVQPSDWLDDGTLLLTDGALGLNTDVVAVRPEPEGAIRPVLEAGWAEAFPQVSPDGRWIAFLSDREGTRRLYVRSWPELERQTLVSAPDQELGWSPITWDADGRTIWYHVPEDDAMHAATLRPVGDSVAIGRRALPWAVAGFVRGRTPDGRILVADESSDGGAEDIDEATHMVVVTNWLGELRRRLEEEGR